MGHGHKGIKASCSSCWGWGDTNRNTNWIWSTLDDKIKEEATQDELKHSDQHNFLNLYCHTSKASRFIPSSLFITHNRVLKCLSVISNIVTLPHQHLYYSQGRGKAKWKPRIRFHLLSAHQQIRRRGPCSVMNLPSLALYCQTASVWSSF